MILFQTVEDRDNADYIESNAPFICNATNAWLGKGYYFWDTLIQNAHWWGNVRYGENYVIMEYNCDSFLEGKCFDLYGNMEHLKHFNEIIDYLNSQNLSTKTATVAKVIEYLKDKTDLTSIYDSVRAYGHFSKSVKNFIPFEECKKYYLERLPAVQICLFHKKSLNLGVGRIVYPNHYNTNYLA
jgi:hypothetical protein